MASLFGDTATVIAASVHKRVLPHAAIQDSLTPWRASKKTVNTRVTAAISVYCNNRNHLWVLVWSTVVWKDKSGKIDCVDANDNRMLKSGKLIYIETPKKILNSSPVLNSIGFITFVNN